jgi:hypothetical protein
LPLAGAWFDKYRVAPCICGYTAVIVGASGILVDDAGRRVVAVALALERAINTTEENTEILVAKLDITNTPIADCISFN